MTISKPQQIQLRNVMPIQHITKGFSIFNDFVNYLPNYSLCLRVFFCSCFAVPVNFVRSGFKCFAACLAARLIKNMPTAWFDTD